MRAQDVLCACKKSKEKFPKYLNSVRFTHELYSRPYVYRFHSQVENLPASGYTLSRIVLFCSRSPRILFPSSVCIKSMKSLSISEFVCTNTFIISTRRRCNILILHIQAQINLTIFFVIICKYRP